MDNFSDHYLKSTLNQLNNLKKEIENIENLYNKLNAKLSNIKSLSDSSNNFKKVIENFISWINKFNKKNEDNIEKKNEFNDNLKNIFEKFISKYAKDNIDEINKTFENMKMIYEDIIDGFDPSNNSLNEIINIHFKNNNSSDKSTNEMEEEFDKLLHKDNKDYSNFYGENEKKSEKKCDKDLICNKCNSKEAIYFCENHCNMYFCEDCYHDIKNYEILQNHKFKRIDEAKDEIEEEKKKFIQSFVKIFKFYLLKCNYILKNKNYNFVDPKTFKKFKYPSLQSQNFEDLEIQKKFLEEINEVENTIRVKIDIKKSINEEDVNYIIINELENIFKNKKVHIGYGINDMDDDFFEEKLVYGENNNNNSKSNSGNNSISFSENDDAPLDEFNSIKKKFLYIINIIKTQNYDFNNNKFREIIIKQISEKLSIDREKIFIKYNNNILFLNDFIKTQEFSELKFKDLRKYYPNLPKLYEFKLLIEGLILYEYRIPKEKLDFNYNFIIPNISLNNRRGKEIYLPPYGWYGIGLRVLNKYKDNDWINKIDPSSEWAVAYYGFPKYLQEKDVKNKIKDILENNKFEMEENLQINFCHCWNKRLEGKRVGNGFYLSPNINLVEGYSKAIFFNKRKYKIILMAKVLIKNIKEPKHYNFWIINEKDDIRFYRLLIKEAI